MTLTSPQVSRTETPSFEIHVRSGWEITLKKSLSVLTALPNVKLETLTLGTESLETITYWNAPSVSTPVQVLRYIPPTCNVFDYLKTLGLYRFRALNLPPSARYDEMKFFLEDSRDALIEFLSRTPKLQE